MKILRKVKKSIITLSTKPFFSIITRIQKLDLRIRLMKCSKTTSEIQKTYNRKLIILRSFVITVTQYRICFYYYNVLSGMIQQIKTVAAVEFIILLKIIWPSNYCTTRFGGMRALSWYTFYCLFYSAIIPKLHFR